MNSKYNFNPEEYRSTLEPILRELDQKETITAPEYSRIIKMYPKDGTGLFAKSEILSGFQAYHRSLNLKTTPDDFLRKMKKKPVRTISGVTPVTVLTKPFPCPGKCIFCPNDIRMPKSYLSDEPGAQRATRNAFDPYLQTWNRLQAFDSNGHGIDKVELIILGGTWSFYPESYQIWFIKRCFDAFNDFGERFDGRSLVKRAYDFKDAAQTVHGSNMDTTYNLEVSKILVNKQNKRLFNEWEKAAWEELLEVQKINEKSKCRNVGLVIETRPDHISEEEVIRIRRLGCTKTQIGFQSLNDAVLSANNRGHDVAATRRAVKLLRLAGFKIHAHWMANLYGSNVEEDIKDYQKLFSDPDFCPDELKIYPCSLIDTAELMQYYQKGLWKPYTREELLEVVATTISKTPQYCRLTRVIRDIPSGDIVDGNKLTNFRQIAEAELDKKGVSRGDIRSREIKDELVDPNDLKLDIIEYDTSVATEFFLQYVTSKNKIVGFLRLSLPKIDSYIEELKDCAMIREVHVYGVTAQIGEKNQRKSQHLGLGTKLIKAAKKIVKKEGLKKMAVISAIGTREYYKKQGFELGDLYQSMEL